MTKATCHASIRFRWAAVPIANRIRGFSHQAQREKMMKNGFFVLPVFLVNFGVHAQVPTDAEKNAYCRYVETAATAQKTLDTGLQAFGTVGQSNNDSNITQAEIGIKKSLSKHLQGETTPFGSPRCNANSTIKGWMSSAS